MKVMTVVGTRPEIIKLSRVIPELDKHFEHVLVHTGQNFDPQLKDVFFKELKIRAPDMEFDIAAKASGGPYVVAQIMSQMAGLLNEHRPDAVLILGDTNSCIATVYAAKRMHIPIFHMEAGNRCFDQRTPEEINRKVVDHLADINLVYTEHARRNLEREGIPCSTIIKTGSPMREVINYYGNSARASRILERWSVQRNGYFVFSAHREENVEGKVEHIVEIIRALYDRYPSIPVVWPVHPRLRDRIAGYGLPFTVRVTEPLGFLDYLQLQWNARCVISDSGTLTEEAALMGFPAVMLREAHERPEGMDAGVTVMTDFAGVVDAVELAMNQPRGGVPDDYAPQEVARQVARIIQSYTGFVNRTVWHR